MKLSLKGICPSQMKCYRKPPSQPSPLEAASLGRNCPFGEPDLNRDWTANDPNLLPMTQPPRGKGLISGSPCF
jgi:hypothetical protein